MERILSKIEYEIESAENGLGEILLPEEKAKLEGKLQVLKELRTMVETEINHEKEFEEMFGNFKQ